MKDAGYSFYIVSRETNGMCGACMKQLRLFTDGKGSDSFLRSASISEICKKMVFPDRKLILPKLNFQLETDRLNSVCTKNMIENFTEMVLNLSEEVGQL